jgi:GntR family transcriptional regulator
MPSQPSSSPASLPRYRRLAERLRAQIAEGSYAPGAQLPTETELALQFDVSRGTVIKAIDQLVAEGIVTKRQGSGSFVTMPSLRRRSSRLLSFTETVDAQGRRASQRVLSYGPADDEQARAMGVLQPAARLVRLRYVDGVACAIHSSIIPQRVMERLPVESLGQILQGGETDFSLYTALRGAGLTIERGAERVSARLATSEEAAALKVSLPVALMVVVRQSFDADGHLIEAAEAVYHADFYTYDLELERGVSHDAPHRLRIVGDNNEEATEQEV